jgi:hypothetical protein
VDEVGSSSKSKIGRQYGLTYLAFFYSLEEFFLFLFESLLFASCTNTFSKWCKITRGMKRSAQ